MIAYKDAIREMEEREIKTGKNKNDKNKVREK
jgi:hypothetical protein